MNQPKSISKIILLCALMHIVSKTTGQDASEVTKETIVTKAWEAMFGELKSEEIKSIYLESYFHGRKVPGRITFKRPNLYRNETENNVIVFDGKRAALIDKSPEKSGDPNYLEIVDSSYWCHFEVDIALIFPAFFEYPSEYKGIYRKGENESYELYVELPLGGNVSYFIDTKSFLITRRLVSWEGDPDQDLWENLITGYIDYEGILFEKGFSFIGNDGREEGYFRNVKFDAKTEDSKFQIPSDSLLYMKPEKGGES